jgi:hypothetical protein
MADCHKIVTVNWIRQENQQNRENSKFNISDGWQRDLVEFAVSYRSSDFALANRQLQRLGHLFGGELPPWLCARDHTTSEPFEPLLFCHKAGGAGKS